MGVLHQDRDYRDILSGLSELSEARGRTESNHIGSDFEKLTLLISKLDEPIKRFKKKSFAQLCDNFCSSMHSITDKDLEQFTIDFSNLLSSENFASIKPYLKFEKLRDVYTRNLLRTELCILEPLIFLEEEKKEVKYRDKETSEKIDYHFKCLNLSELRLKFIENPINENKEEIAMRIRSVLRDKFQLLQPTDPEKTIPTFSLTSLEAMLVSVHRLLDQIKEYEKYSS